MPSATKPFKVAILDDYQRVALKLVDCAACSTSSLGGMNAKHSFDLEVSHA